MDTGHAIFLFASSVLAGAVNSVAGGGTLLSFPAAIAAGLPPIVANATNAVALVPGSFAAAWTFRKHLAGLRRLTALLAVPAILGALVGAAILRHTPQRLFDGVVPWLVFGATLIILLQGVFTGAAGGAEGKEDTARRQSADAVAPAVDKRQGLTATIFFQFLVSIYGGYFGAAMGIIMLAFLGHLPAVGLPGTARRRLDVHQMNALKNTLAVIINGAASVDFLTHGLVRPTAALVMATGAITGGVIGGRMARRTSARTVRRIIIVIGFGMTVLLAWRRYG